MKGLSGFLLIAVTIIMSWQWAVAMPANPVVPTPTPPKGISVSNSNNFDSNPNPILQSIYLTDAKCREGQVLTGKNKRCRNVA
ncbi:hypothetical protein KR018_010671 [Drosophila ironensis]|nr:hypothetical protein KR018_010671 [Drosophila ironensis]